MRIEVKFQGNLWIAFDADTGDELGVGTSIDGAIGDVVLNECKSNGCAHVSRITVRKG